MRDRATLAGLLALAALLRLPDLATRGTWDRDQAHDMLVLRALVRDGEIPLLGPPTSIGDFHHGAFYYYLLSPAAAVTGGDSPLAVATLIALAGVAAVGVTWWLARSIGGPVAALVAGLIMATSAAAIDESTFIWNPNLIALWSAVALAGAWRAWSTREHRWWLVAAIGTALTMQCHVLGAMLLPAIGALLVADLRRRGPGRERRTLVRTGIGGLGIVALSFAPLLVHEVTSGFSETAAALDYLRSGGSNTADPFFRFLIVTIRVMSWPLVGLITEAPSAAILSSMLVVGIVAVLWRSGGGMAVPVVAVRWLGLAVLWTGASLAIAAGSLATVTPGLPNDHYHAFADPMVFTLVGLGAAAAWRIRRPRPGVVALVTVIVGWNLLHLPPAAHPDGGFPAAEEAGRRIGALIGDRPTALLSLPEFKSAEAYEYPLVREGRRVVSPDARRDEAGLAASSALIIVCDELYETAIGAPCDGSAEEAANPDRERFSVPVDRWEAAPGRFVSVYLAAD